MLARICTVRITMKDKLARESFTSMSSIPRSQASPPQSRALRGPARADRPRGLLGLRPGLRAPWGFGFPKP